MYIDQNVLLGLFHHKIVKIPYDDEDLFKMISPRNILIYSPKNNRFADSEAMDNCVDKIQQESKNWAYSTYKNPMDYCEFQKEQQDVFVEWLNDRIK